MQADATHRDGESPVWSVDVSIACLTSQDQMRCARRRQDDSDVVVWHVQAGRA